ncbi:MAG TPA: LuxR C-terminal-related transcriptional regulator [Rubrobacteraceae bacterium]|nr:LuxR C-terminal-related transcriptional regulator [Rubrobacteraceae bacterium]
MNRQLLRAKLYVPRGRADAVPRPRLYERLDEGVRRELTVVSAPAGFGKTTLLADWSWRSELPVAWVSLDERDDDPVRFFLYLIAAIETVRDGFGETTRAFLSSGEAFEPVLTALSNEILESPRDFVLVLDDYHSIRSPTIHDALAYLLDHAPPPIHLVVSGRESPPLPLARLRARGRLTELRAPDLRFTLEEAADFLGRTMGLDLSGERVATLERGTEGWIAGLQLAAHALRGQEDGPVEALAGSARHVFDYLADEVLSRQPEDVREFLLKTSIVETLNGPLCEALTDTSDGQEMLERLERANLFLVPLDEGGRYYRYHHLFAAFLRERLRRVRPDAIRELHSRAGLWYESDGCLAGAVEHALAAEDFDRAADLIEEETSIVRRTYVDTSLLLRWLGTLPDRLVRHRLELSLLYAWALVHSGQLESAERRLRDTEEGVGLDAGASPAGLSDRERTMLGEICIIRARMAAMRENAPLTTEFCNRALDLLPEDDLRRRGDVALDLGHAYCSVGDITAASEAFARAATTGRSVDDLRTALFALRYGASLEIIRGNLRRAEDLLLHGRRLAESRPDGVPSVAGIIHTGMGELLYERGELDEARQLLETGVHHGRQSGEAKILVYGYVNLARVLMARGDAEGAHSLLREAGSLTPRWPLIWAWQARFHLAQGDVRSAARWAREYGATQDYLSYPRHFERITMARVLLGEGRTDEAVDSLRRLLEDARSEGRTAHEIELLALLALARERRDNSGEALDHLERALALAEPEGFVSLFVDEGPPMAALLSGLLRRRRRREDASRNGGPVEYAAELLGRFAVRAPAGGGPPVAQLPGLEPLSERELEVLRLLAAGRSNPQIARELYLAVGTIKAHVHRIYGKLLVKNRTEAVARSRQLGLID